MSEAVDCVVIGAGVVGLAVARALARAGREVMILEQAPSFGTATSSRNSEVIHAGLYYTPGSLKARLCVEGRAKLLAFCAEAGVTALICGKLIVASEEGGEAELERLRAIRARAESAGVTLDWLTAAEARAMEPALRCTAALHSPGTGIIDSHALMLALLGEAEARGALLVTQAPVTGGRVLDGGLALEVGGAEPMTLEARTVINCAGHGASALSRVLIGLDPARVPPHHVCKGSYFSLSGRPPFQRLIYPTPGEASLGLHYTRDLGGRGRFGPDAVWLDDPDPARFDYRVAADGALAFVEAIRRYWPELTAERLTPDYSGMRPKIQAAGEPAHDFVIHGPSATGVNGYIALYGIESPGLTSCLAIADLVAEEARCV
ncbi:FAD-dependent oxidoreductase [Rhodospirillum rubrum]|uniref:NAD(P)/FAD-dependent oxidoreductase n=1 Tax=Rhodospirillum rubrum TaxID=1085 RepID=UPI0019057E8A|nr:NAD(P)/FAD-dependent oxidoreductase [Rhodospirillum rubrum]MBK1666135.1 FAD-dependent oxidoreductase [Rhodospirillum rubrum]MBK1676521.1 FAD-dependent oxidoreductase [Rhodospirillum rubrum]